MNPFFLWVPSQKGLFDDPPQRQKAVTLFFLVRFPERSLIETFPYTRSGPLSVVSTIVSASIFNGSWLSLLIFSLPISTFIFSTGHFFRSAYIRRVIAVHDARATSKNSPGPGPRSVPPTSTDSSAINLCPEVNSCVL